MIVPFINIALGAFMAYMGATGQWALAGTTSSTALMGAGIAVSALGAWQLYRQLRNRNRD